MANIQLIPNLEETLEVILQAIRNGDTESLNLMKAENLVKEIDKLRGQYNSQLEQLRAYYGPKFHENLSELRRILSSPDSATEAAE